MSYNSQTIASIVEKLNESYFLPAIQREYVWKPDQIVRLLDSLMRDYPIGSFLFWKVEGDTRREWQIYRFFQNFDPLAPHNALQDNIDHIPDLTLVLDGQQRLTSLFIALKGTYRIKRRYARWHKESSWEKKQLYLDLLYDVEQSDADDEIETDVHYRFKFLTHDEVGKAAEKIETPEFWFSVAQILQFNTRERLESFVNAEKARIAELYGDTATTTFEQNITQLFNVIHNKEVIAFYTETNQDIDRVLDIFARTNMGGTRLTKSDLLLSMITAKWIDIDAREDINNFVDKLNKKNNDFSKDFVLKTALALTDLPVAYKVENFRNANLETIRLYWDSIKQAISKTVDLVNAFGIDRDTLTSTNALIPIIYYICKNPKANLIDRSSDFDKRNRPAIRKWLLMVLLNRVFSGQSDTVIRKTRSVIQQIEPGADFPTQALNAAIVEMRRQADFSEAATLDEILDIDYRDEEAFLALSLLYDDKPVRANFDIDHIFPQAAFKELGEDQEACHRLANLILLLDSENRQKSDKPVVEWLKSRDSSYTKKHLIPDVDLSFDNFEAFITAREQLIRDRLQDLFNSGESE